MFLCQLDHHVFRPNPGSLMDPYEKENPTSRLIYLNVSQNEWL